MLLSSHNLRIEAFLEQMRERSRHRKFDGSPVRSVREPKPKPQAQWPDWAKAFVDKRAEGERGLGDTIEREIGLCDSVEFIAWWDKTIGIEPRPRCPSALNRTFTYGK